jgi:Domain of unknown function (DUF4082)/PKD domain
MTNGWSGSDPTGFSDPGTSYELGTRYQAAVDVTVSSIRVWSPDPSGTIAPRNGYLRAVPGGAVLAAVTLPDTLSAGWNSVSLSHPADIDAGTQFWVTYGTYETYGAVTGVSWPVASADSALAALAGGFTTTIGDVPTNEGTNFFGVDVAYSIRAVGDPPVVSASTASNLNRSVVLSVSSVDGSPETVSYTVEWGDSSTSYRVGDGTVSHTYGTDGTYAVSVLGVDEDGLVDALALPVTVSSTVTAGLHPNSELVGVAWLKTITQLGNSGVATDLPADNSSWSASGFVQVTAVGGATSMYLPVKLPVLSVDCWAVYSNSGRPPWGKAFGLAEYVRSACESFTVPVRLVLPTGYSQADVVGAWMLSEPRKVREDAADYAHIQFDLQLNWLEVE